MRRIVSRCRAVAPPYWAVAVAIIGFGVFSVPEVVFGQQPVPGVDPPHRYLVGCSILLGFYRVAAFHPYFRPNYLRWLKLTPWTVRKPLPLGPVHLVPEDGPWIGLVVLLSAILTAPRSIELVNAFLFSHFLLLIATFWRTGAASFGYTAAMLLGFVPVFWTHHWLTLLLLTAIYLFVHEGLWRALKRFPWETAGIPNDLGLAQTTDINPSCGWYFDRFHRDINTAKGISRIDALLGCILGSWWLFVIASLFHDASDRFGFLLLCMTILLFGSILIRLAIYTRGYRPPISLRGRVGAFRWVVPGYDQVFIGPICAILVTPAALIFYRNSRVSGEICFSIAAGLTVLAALISPPRLRHWRLTGQHRLAPTLGDSQAASVHTMGQP